MQYHPDLTIVGELVTFAQLEPIRLVCPVPTLARDLAINVSFSNHCYSAEFDATVHDPAWTIMDGRQRRAFDRERYEASMRLPAMVAALPTASVWQLPHDRNFVHVVVVPDAAGNSYPMFFRVWKRSADGADLALVVESAYPKPIEVMKRQIAGSAKVTFPVLCTRAFQGKPMVFRLKR